MDILLHNVGVPLWAVCLVGLILAVLAVLLAKRKGHGQLSRAAAGKLRVVICRKVSLISPREVNFTALDSTKEKLAASRGDTLALTGQDRHAWVEVYYDGIGWIAVDVTPGYYYDLVSLQRLVNLPNDVTKTADLSKNDTRADENSESDNPSSGEAQQEQTAKLPLGRLLSALGAAALLAAVLALLAELLRGILLLLLRRSFRRADALERAKRAEKVLFALLTAKGVQAGLGWNTEQLDAWLAETFPKVQPGEYTRVCELLEKSVYGDIPPEIYEERTIFALLRKLRGLPAGSGFRAQLRSRYGWIPAAVR